MTIDHCPHGFYRGWANGRCAVCHLYVSHEQEQKPHRPRRRDAAMWAAFVHELRAEWIISRHSDALDT